MHGPIFGKLFIIKSTIKLLKVQWDEYYVNSNTASFNKTISYMYACTHTHTHTHVPIQY